MDDMRVKLQLDPDAERIAVTNARPNIALSVRPIKHAIKSKADLRFLIPRETRSPNDIPITLVYCNSRTVAEDIVDVLRQWLPTEADGGRAPEWTDCIAFYHAKVRERRKRELEEKLRKGLVRILVCTDAVGMVKLYLSLYCDAKLIPLQGCNMRNVLRVILWDLPPSFCALIQRAGRAVRDMALFGEAILFVSARIIKSGVTLDDVAASIEEAVTLAEAEGREPETLPGEGHVTSSEQHIFADIELEDRGQRLLVDEEVVRVENMV